MIGVSNLQSFIASMTQKLTLSDISDESKNYLDKAGISESVNLDRKSGSAGMPRPISYAVFCLKKSILQAIAEQSRLVRLPLNQVGSVNKIARELNRFEQEHERKPSVDEIAERVDLPEDKIADAMKANSRHVSMDAPIADGEDSSMIDFLAGGDSSNTDRELAIESLKAEVSRILKLLSDKEQKVVRAFFGIDGSPEMTLDEIGEKYNLTRERVRQIKEKALRRLRFNTKNKLLKSYLGQ